MHSDPERVSAEQLREILEHQAYFSELSDGALAELARSAERVFVSAGTEILGTTDVPEAAFVVEHGRVRCNWGLDRVLLGDLGRGEVFGLGSVLAEQPMSGKVFALRDTRLIRVPAGELPRIVAEHPELLKAYSRWAREAALRSHGMGAAPSLPSAFAVLPLDGHPAVVSASQRLCEAFGRVAGSAVVVDASRLREILGADALSQSALETAPPRLVDWCEHQEAEGRFLVFAGDEIDSAWSRWCMRQTDKVVLVARADAKLDVKALGRRFGERSLGDEPVRVSLVLVHDTGTEVPQGTRRWLELPRLRGHHHVRVGNALDFDRAARRLHERAVGVVLGGGGARGFAHIGVLQALEDAGIPVDHVGGTSIGSIMGAAYARGWAPTEILERVAGIFTTSRAVIDPDIPIVAMLSGAKLDRVLRDLFGDLDVSDLWLPFYAVSASLTRARMVVHDRGPVWRALRASASLPGVFPPVLADDQLLVDGGIVNNVPLDVMGSRCGEGTLIGIDVGGGASAEFVPGGRIPRGWDLLRSRLNPFAERVSAPTIGQILVGSTMLSSKQYLGRLLEEGRVDLYLRLPVNDFELLGFDAYQRLYEIGYETARKELESWERRPV